MNTLPSTAVHRVTFTLRGGETLRSAVVYEDTATGNWLVVDTTNSLRPYIISEYAHARTAIHAAGRLTGYSL